MLEEEAMGYVSKVEVSEANGITIQERKTKNRNANMRKRNSVTERN